MNIFVLSECHSDNATFHADKHVVKMPLESAQIVSTILRKIGIDDTILYKSTHKNHPCVLWAGNSYENLIWTIDYCINLCNEYTWRYNKKHASETVIWHARNLLPQIEYKIPKLGLTPHPQCMPDKYRHVNVVEAYRNYYLGEKHHIFKWTRRDVPRFVKERNLIYA